MYGFTQISKSGFVHGRRVAFTAERFCGFTQIREGGFVFLRFGVKTHGRIHGFACVPRQCRGGLSCCASSHRWRLAPLGFHP